MTRTEKLEKRPLSHVLAEILRSLSSGHRIADKSRTDRFRNRAILRRYAETHKRQQ